MRIDEIRNVVFYDKNGNKVMTLNKITNITMTHEVCAGTIPIISCDLSAYGLSLAETETETEVKKDLEDDISFKEIYKEWL